MQNSNLNKNAIKLASFSVLVLGGFIATGHEPCKLNNESTITVSDEIFKTQSTDVLLETEDIDFEKENNSKLDKSSKNTDEELEIEFK